MQVASNSAHAIAQDFLSDGHKTRFIPAPLVPFSTLATWFKRSRFRAALRTDLTERPHYLNDIGISEADARIELTRFFWEPILMKKLGHAA